MKKSSLFSLVCLAALGFSTTYALEPTDAEAVMTVKLTSKEGQPLSHQKVTFKGKKGSVSGTTGEYGFVDVLLPKGDDFKVIMDTPIGPFLCKECSVPDLPVGEGLIRGQLSFFFDNKRIVLEDVLFDTDKATLKSSSFKSLDPIALGMKENPNVTIEVAGHTDNVGSLDHNMKLSQARADAVRTYLISKGLDESRVTAKGYGPTQPKANNSTAMGKAQNRRTEARIITQ